MALLHFYGVVWCFNGGTENFCALRRPFTFFLSGVSEYHHTFSVATALLLLKSFRWFDFIHSSSSLQERMARIMMIAKRECVQNYKQT